MHVLRLFRADDPFSQIEERVFDGTELIIGRDPGVDWLIGDAERTVSRRHCILVTRGSQLFLRDISANGVFLGPRRDRVAPLEDTPLKAGDRFQIGAFQIWVDECAVAGLDHVVASLGFDAFYTPPLLTAPANDFADNAWDAHNELPHARTAEISRGSASTVTLLEAFCEGARLDPSAFGTEDPIEVMRRLGAVYQQMVLGLGALMNERTSAKDACNLERTCIGAADNNFFKWAPTAQVALDLLRNGERGFLSGPSAVQASFEDLKRHLSSLMAGVRGTLSMTLETLSPTAIEQRLKDKGFVLKTKSAAAWDEFQVAHAELAGDDFESADGLFNRAFRGAYQDAAAELSAEATRS